VRYQHLFYLYSVISLVLGAYLTYMDSGRVHSKSRVQMPLRLTIAALDGLAFVSIAMMPSNLNHLHSSSRVKRDPM